ncbi:glycosylphosphatidylinositol anchor biosynthesis, partial [Ascosphaera acerosa]
LWSSRSFYHRRAIWPQAAPPLPPLLLFAALLALRLANAAALQTFFQPDEFYQSLEPAWALAFGDGSGAWITWEWRHRLRAALHPLLFAGVYRAADCVSGWLGRGTWQTAAGRASVLIAAPRAAQAVFAALTDYCTWVLARRVYSDASTDARAALLLSVLSPWHWFCATRTLSNCLETALTAAALCLWPWRWQSERAREAVVQGDKTETTTKTQAQTARTLQHEGRLIPSLTLAAIACLLRPTNVIIWAGLTFFAFVDLSPQRRSLLRGTPRERAAFCRAVAAVGSGAVTATAAADYLYYRQLTFPPLNFLRFNLGQSLAVL